MRDMTVGNPFRLIVGFVIPMLLGTLFQQFYSMVDTMIVGRYLGVNALAAVGSTGAINFMINGFVIGVCSGFAIPVSQQFGAKDYKNMRHFVAGLIWLSVIFAAVLTVAVSLLTRPILVMMQTPADILEDASLYILIIFLGIPTTFLYNTTASVSRAIGDSRTPVLFLILASLINIVLDFLSIRVFGCGVEGPAIATVVSQAVSGALCFFYMKKNFPILAFEKGEMKPEEDKLVILCKMAIPMGLQYSITAIGSVILQSAVNSLGSTAVAAMTTGQRIGMFFCCVFDALGGTMATYCGQNAGAGKMDHLVDGVRAATLIGCVYAVGSFAALYFFGDVLPLLFVDAAEAEVIKGAHTFLVCNSMFYIPLCFVNVWRFSIQGMGFSGFAVLAGVCEMIARTFIGFAMVPLFGYTAACFASPIAWLAADAFLIPAFYHCVAKLRLLIRQKEEQKRAFVLRHAAARA